MRDNYGEPWNKYLLYGYAKFRGRQQWDQQ